MSVHATDIRVSYGKREILHGVDFTALPGHVTAIVGPNGSGKTTLLKALTGEVPTTGHVRLNGDETRALRPEVLATRRAVLAQATSLAFPFTVLEVVRLGLTAGVATAAPRETAALPHAALTRVGLEGFEGRFYAELSGGEKQRVQLARVLVQIWQPTLDGAPRWLFLDEPVSSLDIAHQLLVMGIAADYAKAGGGVVAVMHDLNLTAIFADAVTLIEAGRVGERGTPEEVLTDTNLSRAYGCALSMNAAPSAGTPFFLPQMARLTREAAE
ncbi:MAG: heme ABC transporter ATP-binding protein [Pseudomonadota bacterium]